MREILVSTHTRHRDPNDPLYMRDWTAQDVAYIAPEGYFTSNKWGGAKRMGVVLLIPDDIPLDFGWFTQKEYDQMDQKLTPWRRARYWIDLTKLVSDEKLKDLYNHDLLVEPVVVDRSYLELFKSFEDRPTILSPYDKQGSFTSGTVNIGPAGDPDANTIFEFESNIANLTGDLTGNVNEAFIETSAIAFAGFTTGVHQFKVYTTGAARHEGKWTEAKHLVDSSGGGAFGAFNSYQDSDIADAIFEGILIKTGNAFVGMYVKFGSMVKKCIVKQSSSTGNGYYCSPAGGTATEVWNSIAIGPGSGTSIGFKESVLKNCTSYGFDVGIHSDSYLAINNSVARSQSDDFNVYLVGDYNASDDGAPGGSSIDISGSTDNEIWTDAPGGDFSLVAGSPLRGNGQDLSGTFTEDINSVTRSTWDIGAWEYAAAAGNPWWYYQRNKMRRAA